MRRERDVEEKDKTLRQQRKALDAQKTDLIKKEAEAKKYQQELEQREENFAVQECELQQTETKLSEREKLVCFCGQGPFCGGCWGSCTAAMVAPVDLIARHRQHAQGHTVPNELRPLNTAFFFHWICPLPIAGCGPDSIFGLNAPSTLPNISAGAGSRPGAAE